MKKIFKMKIATEEMAKRELDRLKKENGTEINVKPKELMDFVQNEQYKIWIERRFSLDMMLDASVDIANVLYQLDWLFLYAPDRTSFITTDNPMILIPPSRSNEEKVRGVGIITPGAIKIIPLTQNTALVMRNLGNHLASKSITINEVRGINLTITSYCDRFVIGRDKRLVVNLIETTRINERRMERTFWSIT